MWRVLTVEADQRSTNWDYLPFYAHSAVKGLYPPLSSECEAVLTALLTWPKASRSRQRTGRGETNG